MMQVARARNVRRAEDLPVKKISIVFLIDYFHRTGGTERHLALLAELLDHRRFDCTVVGFDLGANPLLDGLRKRGIPVIHIPVGRIYVPNAVRQACNVFRLLRVTQADIVQTFHQKADTYGALVARLAGVKHIISSKRDTGELRTSWHLFLNRRLRGLFERVIVVADAVATAVTTRQGIDSSKIVKIYNGVDAAQFRPPIAAEALEARRRLGFTAQDFVVGMVAGFRSEKRHDVFFEGTLKALNQIETLKVLAVGAGPLLDYYRHAFRNGPLANRVTFTGDTADVRQYLWAMDVGCLVPSSNEGFSNAVLEKMAVGLPMIVTAVGGNAEAVVHDENGLVIPPSDSAALGDALVAIHDDPVKRATMGRSSRQLVEEKFSVDAMCAAHAELYLSVCASSRPRGEKCPATGS
jgi:glycosyltransferase involved in cell wall biosynthesis